MKWWTKLRKRRTLDRDLDEEIAFHREMRAEDDKAPPFGNPTSIKESLHDMWTLGWVEAVLQDARYALRGMRRDKGFTITALFVLALAIGANTTMFMVLKRVILDPLPYPHADQLVRVYDFHKERGQAFSVTMLNYLDWAAQTKVFDSLAAYGGRGMTITGEGEPELFIGLGVSANFLTTLGVHPMIGRDFRGEENERGRDRVLILNHSFWQRKFGGNPAVVGRSVRVNGESYEIIGVTPEGFAFPDKSYEALTPLAFRGGDPAMNNRSAHFLRVIGRLSPSATIESARAEMERIASQLEAAYPDVNLKLGVQLRSLKETVVGDSRKLVFVLYGAATLLLLVACANLASLSVARSAARRAEFSIRAALGASRLRLIVQMIVEACMLSLGGGLLGLGLASALVQILRIKAPEVLPRLDEIRLDPAIPLFSIGVTLATGLLFGLGPILGMTRFFETTRGSGARGLRQRMRSVLVVVQVSMALVLLAGAGLFIRSLHNLGQVDLGFDSQGVATTNLVLGVNEYRTRERMLAFARQLDEGLASSPGLSAAGFSTSLPLSGQGWGNPISMEGVAQPPNGSSNIARIQCVSPHYLEALKMPLRAGRYPSPTDDERALPVALVDEIFVRQYLNSGQSPIGRRVKIGQADSSQPWRTIVGVVAASRQFALEDAPEAHLFVPYLQLGDLAPIVGRGLYLAARSSQPATAIGIMKGQINSIDPALAVRESHLLAESVDSALSPWRFRTSLMTAFAGFALLLAAVGLYGVIAFAVAQQTQEIGVRIALGAQRVQITRAVLGSGARLGGAGIVIGVGCALALSQAMEKEELLFGVGSRDWLSLSVGAVVLGVVTLFASYVPARRAASVDPMRALRME